MYLITPLQFCLEKLKCCLSVGLQISVKFCKEKGGGTGCQIKQILVNLQQESPLKRVEKLYALIIISLTILA